MTPRKLLLLFIKSNKKCYYCGVKTKMPKQGKTYYSPVPNLATVEHIYSRMDIRRFLSHKSVLACQSCNGSKAYRDYDLVFNNGTYSTKEYGMAQITNGLLINLYNGDYSQLAI